MKNRILTMLGLTLVFVTPLVCPATTWAQAPFPGGIAMTPPKGINISVDYVTAPQANFYKEASRITPGKKHDALLLAALLKSGAHITPGPQINTVDGIPGRTSETQTVPVQVTSFVQVSPQINQNGSITVTMTNHLESPSPSSTSPPSGAAFGFGENLPSVNTTEVTETNTFQDGQTLMVGSVTTDSMTSQGGTPAGLFIFAKVTSTAKSLSDPTAH